MTPFVPINGPLEEGHGNRFHHSVPVVSGVAV